MDKSMVNFCCRLLARFPADRLRWRCREIILVWFILFGRWFCICFYIPQQMGWLSIIQNDFYIFSEDETIKSLCFIKTDGKKAPMRSRPRVRTRMSVSRAHAHAGLAHARALIARLFFLAQLNENDVSAAARLRTLCGSPAHAVAGPGPCRCKAPFSSKIEAVAHFDGSLLF